MKKIAVLFVILLFIASFAACSTDKQAENLSDVGESTRTVEEITQEIKEELSYLDCQYEQDGNTVTMRIISGWTPDVLRYFAEEIVEENETTINLWDQERIHYVPIQTAVEEKYAELGHPEIDVRVEVYSQDETESLLVFKVDDGELQYDIMPELIDIVKE